MLETFMHRYVRNTGPDTLLLLHGTGGDENDLLSLGSQLDPGANLLSPRGKVLEQGMPRFFRRLRPGVFDLEDLRLRTSELAQFIRDAAQEYQFDPTRVIAVGYSNGANVAASALYREAGLLAGALLLRPMNPWPDEQPPPLNGIPVLIAAGRYDNMSSEQDIESLSSALKNAGANLTTHWHAGGHELGSDDLAAAKAWMGSLQREVSTPIPSSY